jgi:hypothetical protein
MSQETPTRVLSEAQISPEVSEKTAARKMIFWGIATSLVGSIIFSIWLQPIVTFVSDLKVEVVNIFYHGYIDGAYDNAAQNSAEDLTISRIFLYVLF